MKLEHIAPYLPYRLKWVSFSNYEDIKPIVSEMDIISSIHFQEKGVYLQTPIDGDFHYSTWTYNDFKPILRPLSDLTKEITHNGETFVPLSKLDSEYQLTDEWWLDQPIEWPYFLFNIMVSWHFDVFDLRAKNECIYYSEIHQN